MEQVFVGGEVSQTGQFSLEPYYKTFALELLPFDHVKAGFLRHRRGAGQGSSDREKKSRA